MDIELAACSRAFQELEDQRRAVLSELAEWPPACLCFRPTAGAWSAVEVLDHIVRVESGTLGEMRAGLQSPHVLGNEDRAGIAVLDRALRSDKLFQVPAGADDICPLAGTTFPEVAMRWEQARRDLTSMLGSLTPADARCGVFRHPFAGWMTVAEVLDHFSAHLYHHRFQLARLRASSSGPPA